jgi:hypothetical protein
LFEKHQRKKRRGQSGIQRDNPTETEHPPSREGLPIAGIPVVPDDGAQESDKKCYKNMDGEFHRSFPVCGVIRETRRVRGVVLGKALHRREREEGKEEERAFHGRYPFGGGVNAEC